MKKLTRKQLIFYGMAGIGPNMLNLMMGAYLCDALYTRGFSENIENWTFLSKDLIIIGIWGIIITIAKIIDGFIDIPLGNLADNLKTKWGKRRPSLLFGLVIMILSYVMFLVIPKDMEGSLFNTIWFAFWLILFYSSYTLTMLTYYATFSEITENDSDRVLLSNAKSTMDIVYFILGYALVPALVGSFNIRFIALLSMVLLPSMIIPFFLIKERSTLTKDVEKYKEEHPEDREMQIEKHVNLFDSVKYTIKNKNFLIWMTMYGALQFGLSMYLTGFNVYFSGTMNLSGLEQMLCNVSTFAPVPFTLILYNYITKKKGFAFAFRYSLIMFCIGMTIAVFMRPNIVSNEVTRLIICMISGVICAFGIGSFFSVSYTIPSHIAAEEKEKTGISNPSMYFAIQGLFEAGVAAIATGIVWVSLRNMKPNGFIFTQPAGGSGLLTFIVAISCILSCVLTVFLPKSLKDLGKVTKEKEASNQINPL